MVTKKYKHLYLPSHLNLLLGRGWHYGTKVPAVLQNVIKSIIDNIGSGVSLSKNAVVEAWNE
jgi:hypothetical protein